MSTITVPYLAASVRRNPSQPLSLEMIAANLEQAFASPVALWNAITGECVLSSPGQPNADDAWRGAVARVLATQCDAEIIAEECPLVVLAVPLTLEGHPPLVATGTFVVEGGIESVSPAAAQLLGLDETRALAWIAAQRVWSIEALLLLSDTARRSVQAEARARRAAWEVERVSENLAATYEEICLLHEMTNNLRLSQSDDQLGQLALDRLMTCLPASGAAIQFLAVADPHDVTYKARVSEDLLTAGDCLLDNQRFDELIAHLGLDAGCGPFVANADITGQPEWPFPEVRQLILVPLAETEKLFGWLALINHVDGDEFGSIEASLLGSVGAILGIHCGNRDLYRLQDEFLAAVVRAMTSAIDAKDPYTCGHSDRVARISVRLAQQLGLSTVELANIYMAGLLHDVGKIGIDDQVLRKHGKLTTEEFEHIKEHPDLGCKILADLKPLASVLPAVRHHHEQWDGRGYPSKLVAEEIPFIARIVAVADAYDAMISDRPYRRGMPIEKVEEIFRKGAGQQWDRVVIEAYFTARDDIREISRRERANLSLDITRWT
jgi:hypothetical protein